MNDWSQSGEQAAILAAFEGAPPGRFLDVGAYHPTCFSNTRALFEMGWSGLMIEPSPGPRQALLKEYGNEPRITILSAAMAIEPGFIPLHVTDDAVSTSSEAQHEQWREAGGYYGKLCVPTITWEQIGNQFGGFDMVNIDAEGTSADLFLRMLQLNRKPHCVCCEYDNRLPELCSAATRSGYRLTSSNGTNAIYVR